MSAGIINTINVDGTMSAINKEIGNFLLALAEALIGKIQTLTPVGSTGHLRGSYAYGMKQVDNGVSVAFGSPLEYGAYVEHGTRPHWVPIEELKRWVETKIQPHVLSVGVSFENGKATPAKKGTRKLTGDARQKAVLRVAYAIQKKIAEKGTIGKEFVAQAMRELGLEYEKIETDSGYVYQVNVIPFLEKYLPQIMSQARLV